MRIVAIFAFGLVAGSVSLSQAASPEKKQSLFSNPVELTAEQTIDAEPLLNAPDRKLLRQALANQFDTEDQKDVAFTRIRVIDLNKDGVPEVIAQAVGELCSPTGNCPFWVFKRTSAGYKVILARGSVQTFSIEQIRHNGYLDIVVGMHGSATEQDLRLYQFTGKQYRNAACYNANWSSIDKNGNEHELKHPRITRCVGYR